MVREPSGAFVTGWMPSRVNLTCACTPHLQRSPGPLVRIQHFDLQVPVDVQKPSEEDASSTEPVQRAFTAVGAPRRIFVTIGSEAGPTELSDVQEVPGAGEIDHYASSAGRRASPGGTGRAKAGSTTRIPGRARLRAPVLAAVSQGSGSGWGSSLWVASSPTAPATFYEPTQGEAKSHEVWLAFHPIRCGRRT